MQPFLKYVVVGILIAPLVASSGRSTEVEKSQAKNAVNTEHDSVPTEATVSEAESTSVPSSVQTEQKDFSVLKSHEPISIAVVTEPQIREETEFTEDNSSPVTISEPEQLAAVQLAPQSEHSLGSKTTRASQLNLVARLRAAKIQSATQQDSYETSEVISTQSLIVAKVIPLKESSSLATAVPVVEQPMSPETEQKDPINSPHPIPWQWIQATQESISSRGEAGVRYYRSVPVISPDGRYAIYSRVQLEVNPQTYNSRVSSVLFVEDRQTKKLRVIASTSPVNDPLLKVKASLSDEHKQGTIAVLVPVSWSANGDRFLARKFEAIMNTSDATDHAVIWDRQKHEFLSVTPAQHKHEHEKIAILLGWSKFQPDQVLFRTGELGDENWPLMTVAHDGSTVMATEADQPVTFGQKITEVWAGPPVAYR